MLRLYNKYAIQIKSTNFIFIYYNYDISSLPSLSATAADVSSCPLSPPVPLLRKAVQEGDQQYRGDPHSPQPPAGGSCVPGGTTRPSWLSVYCHPDSPSIPVCSGIPHVAGREKDVSEHVTVYMYYTYVRRSLAYIPCHIRQHGSAVYVGMVVVVCIP